MKMSNPQKFKKDKEIIAEYESQVKGKLQLYYFTSVAYRIIQNPGRDWIIPKHDQD